MFQSVSGISTQTCTNGFYCKNIGTTDTSINVKNFCKLAHDKEYIFSAMALRRGQKFHIRLEVLDNRSNFFVGLTLQNPSNLDFNLLPSNHLLLPECMLFTEIFAVSGRKFEMGIQECVFFYNDNGEFIMENLSLNESSRIGCVVPHDNLWIVFKCSISFPNLFFVRSPMDTGYNGNYEGNVPVITRLLPGYFDDTSKRNTAVYNDPNNSPETNKLRLKSFLATKGICLGRPFYNSIIPLEDSIIPLQNPILHQQLNNCYVDQTKPLQTEIKILEKSKENEDNKSCVVCLTESKTCLCFPCGHVCFCDKCSKLFSQNNKSCPICRQEIEGICKVYY